MELGTGGGVQENWRACPARDAPRGCALALRQGKMMVANVGDSRAISGVFVKGQGISGGARELTRDHKPGIPGEKARIEACGGEVKPLMVQGTAYGPDRVWMKGQETPGLQLLYTSLRSLRSPTPPPPIPPPPFPPLST